MMLGTKNIIKTERGDKIIKMKKSPMLLLALLILMISHEARSIEVVPR